MEIIYQQRDVATPLGNAVCPVCLLCMISLTPSFTSQLILIHIFKFGTVIDKSCNDDNRETHEHRFRVLPHQRTIPGRHPASQVDREIAPVFERSVLITLYNRRSMLYNSFGLLHSCWNHVRCTIAHILHTTDGENKTPWVV